ncbi:MAG: glycoside hydrolase domain-containing protein, partial [Candidatus Helarchaeota archaeon]
MIKLRYFAYEMVSISLGLALLAFFGILSFLPIEIMIMGEEQTIYWLYIALCLSAVIAFLLLSFCPKRYHFILLRILNSLMIILIFIVSITYLQFTQDLFEPWLIQTGWFFRYHGILLGFFLGVVLIQTITGLSMMIFGVNNFKKSSEIAQKNNNKSYSNKIMLVILILTSAFLVLELLFFRYFSFFISLISIFILESSFAIFSILQLFKTNYYEFIYEIFPKKAVINTEKNGNGIIYTINSTLRKAGTNPSIFWHLFIPLFFVFFAGIAIIVLSPLNLLIHVSFPYGIGVLEYDVPLPQLISYLLIAVLLFILAFNAYGERMKTRLAPYYDTKLKSRVKVSTFGIIDGMRFLGLFLVISQILYYFEYPIYFPRVISFYLLCGGIGSLIFFGVRTQKFRKILYISAVLLLILNFYITYIDGTTFATNPYSGEFDITFPFLYLHSWVNFLLVGIPVGVILSDLFFNLAFTHTTGADAVNRALLLTITPFIGGMILIPGNYLNDNPGGNPPLMPQNYLIFYYSCLILGVLLAIGLFFNYLVTEVLVPRFIEKKLPKKVEKIIQKPKKSFVKYDNIKNLKGYRKKILVISLIGVVFLSSMGGFGIYTQYSQVYQRPILIYEPGNYWIWLQNSSERVSRNVLISESSPRVDVVKMFLAKNEYAAVQFVWRPFRPIQSLSYEISDFYQQNGSAIIKSSCFTLRYVDYIIEDEFPDLLRSFTEMDLDKKENYVFWFAVRTPYNASAGVYKGNLTFNFDVMQKATISIQLNIWNFTIPRMRHLRTNIGGRSENYERINNYITHRLNDYGVDIYYTDNLTLLNTVEKYTCYLNKTSGEWTFNWTWWDTIIQYKLENGMNAFTVNYPLGIADGWDPYIENATRMRWLKNWLKDVEAHLEFKNWLNYSYLYFIDEFNVFIPAPYSRAEYFNRCRILLSEIKNASPKIKIMTTTPPSKELEPLREYIDIFCPISNDRDKERWDERLAAGCEFWTYTCIG